MTSLASDWIGIAYNQVPHSSNKIHSDQIAKTYGFKGGLVPGVTLSAYLAHPAVVAWGTDWLSKGYIHVKIESPIYDNHKIFVEVDGDETSYTADLVSEGKRCAMAHVRLIDDREFSSEDLSPHNIPFIDDTYQAPIATRENMERLKQQGCPTIRFRWTADHEMASYLKEADQMPALLNTNKETDSKGLANLSFLLGCANRHFAAVALMNPWVHVETKSHNFEAVELDTCLISEMKIVDLFDRKGHEFADCEFKLFDQDSNRCVCSIWQRAIYKMRDT